MEKLKVAFVAASMPNFSKDGPKIFQQYQDEMQKLATSLDFDLTVYKD